VPFTNSPAYDDAKLSLVAPTNGSTQQSGEDVAFDFTVENYELGVQTPSAEDNGLANSGKGQHIHLILNNEPYSAHYEPDFAKNLEDGTYTALAFLSRSYHESVKNPNAFTVINFTVGGLQGALGSGIEGKANLVEQPKANLNLPHMFYSRPKGTYKGDAINKLLLDFYLVNATLSTDGYKVRATITNNSKTGEFLFTTWQPYVVEGLSAGEVMVRLEFLDENNTLVDSPFNPVERTCMLEAAPAEAQ
jgi:hypothetical protein